jgi:hypothetical protein
MPIQHVDQLARALHEAGVVNLDTKISDVLKVAGVGELTPGSKVASGAVAAAFQREPHALLLDATGYRAMLRDSKAETTEDRLENLGELKIS